MVTGAGQSGLALYRSRRIDCVVLELSLPDQSGFQTLAELVPVARGAADCCDCPHADLTSLRAYHHTSCMVLRTLYWHRERS
jgi:DNA-binding NarL/FixJ family response regulator